MTQVLTDDDDIPAQITQQTVDALDGNDIVIISNTGDTLFNLYNVYGGQGGDFLGMELDNAVAVFYGGGGADTLHGSPQGDFLYGNLFSDLLVGGEFDYTTFINTGKIEAYLDETSGDDMLTGDEGADALYGLDGNDTLYGGNDDDAGTVSVPNGAGAATSVAAGLYGGAGNDYLDGGRGNDTLDGGADADTLLGGEGNDKLDGGTGADYLEGGRGNDSYYVNVATDKVAEAVGNGADTVYASVSYVLGIGQSVETLSAIDATATTAINLTGNELGQRILGNAGKNVVSAGDGADAVYGYGGSDDLRGGLGADTFVYTRTTDSTVATTGRDVIRDFSRAQGDKIDLRTLDANAAAGGNQAFKFIGVGAFTGQAGELRATTSGAYTTISADVNGDATADFAILVNATTFVAGDFLL